MESVIEAAQKEEGIKLTLSWCNAWHGGGTLKGVSFVALVGMRIRDNDI